MKDKLTKKQKDVFEIICTYIDKNKISPTIRELMDMVGLKSTSTMHSYLERLKEKGYITWKDCSPRTIQILKRDPREDYYQFSHYFLPYSFFKYPRLIIEAILKYKENYAVHLKNTWSKMPLENEGARNNPPDFVVSISNFNDDASLILITIPDAKLELEALYLGILYDENYKVRYFTYEIGSGLDSDKNYILCEWTTDWDHISYELYKEDGKEAFINGIRNVYKNQLV